MLVRMALAAVFGIGTSLYLYNVITKPRLTLHVYSSLNRVSAQVIVEASDLSPFAVKKIDHTGLDRFLNNTLNEKGEKKWRLNEINHNNTCVEIALIDPPKLKLICCDKEVEEETTQQTIVKDLIMIPIVSEVTFRDNWGITRQKQFKWIISAIN